MIAQFSRDSKGITEILKSAAVAAAVHDMAEDVAQRTDGRVGNNAEVDVYDYTTDRAASSVVVTGARAGVLQARDGVLTKSAADVGLEVRAE